MSQHIFVISHRRSGTHLTIDAIRNNFLAYKLDYLNIDLLTSRHKSKLSLESLTAKLAESPRILKSHTHSDLKPFFEHNDSVYNFIAETLPSSKVIYVYRDGRDVLTSLYFYMQRDEPAIANLSMSEFIRMENDFDQGSYEAKLNRIEYWSYHLKSWFGRDELLYLNFDELVNHYPETINRMANFLALEPPQTMVDIRRRESKYEQNRVYQWFKVLKEKVIDKYLEIGVRHTSVRFRKGKSQDYLNYFTEDDLDYFDSIASDVMSKVG
jgi:hypothetical protein